MRDRVLRLLTRLLWAAVAGCLVGAAAGWGAAQFFHVPQVDQLASFRPAATTRVLATDGTVVATFARERRIVLKPEEIPDVLKLAIVAAEDADFYEHGGVDLTAILRAAIGSLKGGHLGAAGGGSTLTQQLALNLFLTREHSLSRKVREALLAINIERELTKDQILTMYANLIYFGHGAYGVEAASRLYFGKPARELTLAEAALLAGIIQSPERHSPIRNPDNARDRRAYVLHQMVRRGDIDTATANAAAAEPLPTSLHRQTEPTGSYFAEWVRQYLDETYGTNAVYEEGLDVHTTMDPGLQRAAERAVREGLVRLDESFGFRDPQNVLRDGLAASIDAYDDPDWHEPLTAGVLARAVVDEVEAQRAHVVIGDRQGELTPGRAAWTRVSSLTRILEVGDLVLVRLPDELPEDESETLVVELAQEPTIEGALVAIDNQSGEVLALVGGFDFDRSEFNRAVQAQRQCGSAFKPFVYLTAFERGYTPADTLFDAPFLLEAPGMEPYVPKNYYGKYYGITTLRRALELSHNATAVKLQQLVGGEAVVETARRFGISSELQPYPSLALGAFEVRLLNLARAYAGIANLGQVPEPRLISEIDDDEGSVLERHYPRSERVVPPAIAYLMVSVLEGVVDRGTGAGAASLGGDLGGKTGTTDDYTDAWFMGFSPRITVGVWVGRDQKKPIGRRMTGAAAALPIWISFMKAYRDTLSDEEWQEKFPVPAGIAFSPIDLNTGLRATPSCPRVILESFLDGTEPSESCNQLLHEIEDAPWPLQRPLYTPKAGEPMPTPEAVAIASERITGRE